MDEEVEARATLPPGQRRVMDLLREKERRVAWVSVREIGQALGIASPNGVLCHLEALEKKGLIRRPKNLARGIEIVHESEASSHGE